MATTLIVTASPQISIPRCILLASNFLSNVPDAQIYVTSASRLKDIGRQRLSPGEKNFFLTFSSFSEIDQPRNLVILEQYIVRKQIGMDRRDGQIGWPMRLQIIALGKHPR